MKKIIALFLCFLSVYSTAFPENKFNPFTGKLDIVNSAAVAPAEATYVTLSTNATLTNERVLTGTANQVILTDAGAGSTVTLSTPQNIHTAATPEFSTLSLSATLNQIILQSAGVTGTLTWTPATTNKVLTLPNVTSTVAVYTDNLSVFAATTSLQLLGLISDETGSGLLVFNTSPTLVTPLLGIPTSGTLTNCTGLPISTGVSGLGTGVATFLATPSSANLLAAVTDETGTGVLVFGTTPTITTPVLNGIPTGTGVATAATASTLVLRDANANASNNNDILGYTTTATAAGTTTLTVGSTFLQYFTGVTTQTVLLPVTSTLVLGQQWLITNISAGAVTIQSSGANNMVVMAPATSVVLTCILTSGTTPASWATVYAAVNVSGGKKLTVSNTLTLTGTDGSSVAFGAGGTVAYVANDLSVFAATTSAQLAGVISDETGTGVLVFGTSPGFTTAANPISNDGAALGTTALNWSDIFLASGAVVNFNNGDITLTHSANLLTLAGGDFQVNGNMALGGTAIDSTSILVAASNVTDPITQMLGAQFSRTLVLTAANAQTITGFIGNVSSSANAFNHTGILRGASLTVQNANTAIVTNAYGNDSLVYNTGVGTITNGVAGNFAIQNLNAAGIITNAYGVRVQDFGLNGGTITNTYGVYVGDITLGTQTNTPFSFYASDAGAYNYFAGRVGVGTNTPTAPLTVSSASGNVIACVGSGILNQQYRITNTNADAAFGIAGTVATSALTSEGLANATVLQSISATALQLGTTNIGRVTILAGGNVGIGTIAPAKKFESRDDTGNAPISVYRGANTATFGSLLEFALNDSVSARKVYADIYGGITTNTAAAEDGFFVIRTMKAGTITEQVRVTSAGNVGIGLTAPNRLFEVQIASNVGANTRFSELQAVNTQGMYVEFMGGAAGTTARGYIGYGKTGAGAASIFTSELADSFCIRAQGAMHLGSNGDNIAVTIDTGQQVGIGLTPVAATGLLQILAADDGICANFKINIAQASVTAADVFVNFASTSGVEGSVAGTAVTGVIAYLTFTGAHISQSETIVASKRKWKDTEKMVFQGDNIEPGTVLVSKNEMCKWREGFQKSLPKCEISTRKDDKAVYGVYGGHDRDGNIQVLAIGSGVVLVCDEGGDIEVGDLLSTSSRPGLAMRYDGSDMRVVLGKARESFKGEKGLIACTYYAG